MTLKENRAVTVLKASLSDYSPDTGLLSPDAKHITRYTFWAQSCTIRCTASEVLQCHGGSSFCSEGKLCLAMCRLPNVESCAAEVSHIM